MYNLEGKKLLVMDTSALGACAVRRAKEMGIKTIVANFYPEEKSASKQIADEKVDIDISHIDEMVELVKERHIDGIFVGWTDSHLPFYVEICERTGLPCCGTKEQFEILSNDKRMFKKCCLKYGIPTIPEYKLDINLKREDLDHIEYPVLVKPADESGSRGVKRCDNEKELVSYYAELYAHSKSKKIIVEKYIDSQREIFIHFTVQDGYCSLSNAFMKHKAKTDNGTAASAILHVFGASDVPLFRETVEANFDKMIQGLGIKNAVTMLQGFQKDGQFYFYESGLRMGGEQFYVFTQRLNGISALDMMIEFALTGKMTCGNAHIQDNWNFSKECVNYYITLNPGKITSISGVEEIEKMPQVLQNATFKKIGDYIDPTNSLDRVIYRLHVMDDTKEALAKTLEKISNTLCILDENGNEMQVEHLTYNRAYEMLINS